MGEFVIKRDLYLNKLIRKKNNGSIKIITGLRRSGKSYLLNNLYYEYLLSEGVKKEQIIKLALDDDRNREYRNPDNLSKFLYSKITNETDKFYFLLDEVQFAISDEENAITLFEKLSHLKRKGGEWVGYKRYLPKRRTVGKKRQRTPRD